MQKKKFKFNRFNIIAICLTFALLLFFVSTLFQTYSDYVTKDASKIEGDTVYVNDLASDYYYYLGMNYVGDINSNSVNYSESDLKMITINYYGYPSNNPSQTGYVSLSEKQNKFVYYKYFPVINNQITIELIDNPFSLRPVGKGFGGWTSSDGTITKDNNTNTYTLTINSSTSTVNIYANWQDAKVIFLKGQDGDDNFDGSSDYLAVASWGRAFELLRNNNSNIDNRELNIIVLTGPLDHSINYSRRVTHTWDYSYTYHDNETFTSGNEYLIEYKNGNNRYALYDNWSNVGMEVLSTTTRPSDKSLWIITHDENGYLIRNKDSGNYLGYEQYYNDQVAMFIRNTPYYWEYESNLRTFFTTFQLTYTKYVYTLNDTINNSTYLIADQGSYSNSNNLQSLNILNNSLTNTAIDSQNYNENDLWRVNSSGTGYTIMNNNTNTYLNYSSLDGTTNLVLNNNPLIWNYDSANHTLETEVNHYVTEHQYNAETISSGTFYIGYMNGDNYALLNNNLSFSNFNSDTLPTNTNNWTFIQNGMGFYIRNSSNQYLRVRNGNLSLTTNQNQRTTFYLDNNRLYTGNYYLYRNGNNLAATNNQNNAITQLYKVSINDVEVLDSQEIMYLNFNNNSWGLSTSSSPITFTSYTREVTTEDRRFYLRYDATNSNFTFDLNTQGTGLYFGTFEEDRTMIGTNSGNITNNNYYNSSNNSVAVTITSMYDETDYRDDATLTLTNNNYFRTIAYRDLQLEYLKVSSTGYRIINDDNTTIDLRTTGSSLTGNSNNVRIGRGMVPDSWDDTNSTIFAFMQGGGDSNVGSTYNTNNAYKFVVESGRYSGLMASHIRNNYGGTNYYDYYGNIYLTIGNDYDRATETNNLLDIYYRMGSSNYYGVNGTNDIHDYAYLMNIKSGTIGMNYFNNNTDESRAYSGIYVGGLTVSASAYNDDVSNRVLIVEGGDIANINGGLRIQESTGNSGVQTKIYVKSGNVQNIVGGAGVSTTYGDRYISVTGGNVAYSISGGSNGIAATNETDQSGRLGGDSYVHVGGEAHIGTASAGSLLYDVARGSVLGAGNGNEDYGTSGRVNTSHVYISGDAIIEGNVFGGGNFGPVSVDSNITIDGGTISGNVFGGANKKGVGTVSINESTIYNVNYSDNQDLVSGNAYLINKVNGNSRNLLSENNSDNVYNVSLLSGNRPSDYSRWLINGDNTNGYTIRNVNYNGYLAYTTGLNPNLTINNNSSNAIWNYDSNNKTFYKDISYVASQVVNYNFIDNITSGSEYILSNGNNVNNTIYYMDSSGDGVRLSTTSQPTDESVWIITSSGGGYTIRNKENGRYLGVNTSWFSASLSFNTQTEWTWSASNHQFTYTTSGWFGNTYYLRYNNGWELSTTESNVYPATFRVNTTMANDRFYLIYDNAWKLSKTASEISLSTFTATTTTGYVVSNNNDGDVNITMNDGKILGAIYGGACEIGNIAGTVTINVNGGQIGIDADNGGSIFGGGYGEDTFVANGVDLNISDNKNVKVDGTIYGGSALGTIIGNVIIDATDASGNGNITVSGDFYCGSMGDSNIASTGIVQGNCAITLDGGTYNGSVFGGNNANGSPSGSITVTTGGNNSTTINNVYGGGNKADSTATTVVLNIENNSNITNAFGGGNEAEVSDTHVNLHGGKATNIYGGSNQSGNITTSNITTTGGEATNIYGGNNLGGTTTNSTINVNGGTITNIFGGGNEATTTATTINLNSGTISNTYGGGNKAGVTTSTTVNLLGSTCNNIYGGSNTSGDVPVSYITCSSGTADTIYGGNNLGGVTETTNVDISNITVGNVYGGGNAANTGTDNVIIHSGTISNIFGGGKSASVNNSTNISVLGGNITNVFGGSNTSGTVPESHVDVTTGTIGTIYGGNNEGGITTTTNVNITNGTITNIYGGGNAANVVTANVIINNSSNEISNIFGGCKEANANTTNITLNNGRSANVFGGSNTSGVINNSHITIYDGTYGNLYGGNNDGGKTITSDVKVLGGTVSLAFGGGNNAETDNTNIVVDSGTISNILYGGGNNAVVNNNTNVTVQNSAIIINSVYAGGNNGQVLGNSNVLVNSRADIGGHVFGGGNNARVIGDTNVLIDNGVVRGNVYGGGNYGIVSGSTNVNIKDTVILGSAYAGGNGETADVGTNTTITVQGSSNIAKHVFGGGNAADTGTSGSDTSLGLVNITGGTIVGNVYGGANTAVLYGETVVNIGIDAVSNYMDSQDYAKGNIHIGGTIFGGGEANESGSEVYDFDFISVTKGIIINIDGNNHTSFDILGSIFGSGNASRTTGYSRIYLNNYGSENNIKNNISLQRADIAVLNNSHIALSGATDRTNEYSQVVFSVSRITELDLKNSSEIYLENGANLLTKFRSLNADDTLAEVEINENTHTVNRKNGTNNRLYMLEDKVLNIALNQNVTAYGEVDGMTFFGMFKRDRNGNIVTAMYDTNYTTGSTAIEGDLYYFDSGSYVLGSHETNHDIKVDGFYTNYSDPNPNNHGKILVDYITPSPENAEHYMWTIGVSVQSYDIELVASKYSTLGTYEFPFINNSSGNTTFSIVGFNYDELNPSVSLIDPSQVDRIASSGTVADNTMGLAIKPGIGWVNVGSTYFLTDSNPKYRGLLNYKSENSNVTPSFVFYLYHSKNLQTEGLVGKAVVSLEVVTPIDDLTNHVERINFNITITRAIFDTNDYEGAMTPGREYEMFTSSKMDITSKSSLSAYYSLYMESPQTIYRNGYHRVLNSNVMLPVNTKITMIDFASATRPEYYYYIVNQSDNDAILSHFNRTGEAQYPLSKFIRMGSLDTTNKYDDSVANGIYYDDIKHHAIEEFIFIVDFKNANIQENMYNCSLLIDMIDDEDHIVHSVLGIQRDALVYNLHANQQTVIDVSANVTKPILYAGDIEDLRVTINFNQNDIQSLNRIVDTTYYEQKLGLKISFINERGSQVNGADLLGTSLTLDGTTYYARSDGTIRFKISDKVANSYSNIRINTLNSSLAAGNYTIKVEAFYSTDGIYFGRTPTDECEVNFRMMNKSYGLEVSIPEEELIIDKTTGLNINKNRMLNANITYSGSLIEPNMKVSLYRRSYESVNDLNYNLVDLTDYITNDVTSFGNNTNIYNIISELGDTNAYTFNFNSGLVSGTYKLEFKLYDGDLYVGNIIKYIIIK